MKKRLASALLTLCMAFTLFPTIALAEELLISSGPQAQEETVNIPGVGGDEAILLIEGSALWLVPQVKAAPDFPDVNGTWCESYVDTVYRSGLMAGKTDTRFDATSPLTHAQITVICARLYELLTDGDGVIEAVPNTPWYQASYDLLVEAGVLYTDEQAWLGPHWYARNANEPCDREFFVGLLGYVLEKAGVSLPEINDVTRIPDISPNFRETPFYDFDPYIYDFYRYGILNGADPYGGFHETASLTRGAAAAMLARLVDPAQRLEFELPSFDICADLLGVEYEAVLLVVDGLEVTAEQMGYDLAYWLANTYTTPDALLENAINGVKKRVSRLRLAEELSLPINQEYYKELQTTAQTSDGHMGFTAEGFLWREMSGAYEDAFIQHFLPKYGDKHLADGIDQEVNAKMETLSVERTELLDSLDLDSIHAKCKNSPFGIF